MPLVGERKREYQRAWNRGRRLQFIAGQCCAKCGSTENLELDHIDPKSKADHRIWTWSISRIEAEVAKCQWLCRNCHVEKSVLERGGFRRGAGPHGSKNRYDGGCRCDCCRRAYSQIRLRWK